MASSYLGDMKTDYLTLASSSEGLLKEKGSKFFAYAIPMKTENELEPLLQKIKKEHHAARHHCFAYRIGIEGELHRSNDDGEPSHSAGEPILRQLLSHDLTNVLVIVVRYFGGTKLGVGGLIKAYGGAASLALESGKKTRVDVHDRFKLEFPYSELHDVMRILKQWNVDLSEHDFKAECRCTIEVPLNIKAAFLQEMATLFKVIIKPNEL